MSVPQPTPHTLHLRPLQAPGTPICAPAPECTSPHSGQRPCNSAQAATKPKSRSLHPAPLYSLGTSAHTPAPRRYPCRRPCTSAFPPQARRAPHLSTRALSLLASAPAPAPGLALPAVAHTRARASLAPLHRTAALALRGRPHLPAEVRREPGAARVAGTALCVTLLR
jgi:hypothetical protein